MTAPHTHVGHLKCYLHDIRRDKVTDTVWSTDVGLHVRHSVLCSILMAGVWRLAGFLQMTPTPRLIVTSEQAEKLINPFMPNDHYSGLTVSLNSKSCILYIYSTNICTEYFKHGIYSPCFSLQNAVCFIILTYLVPVLFTFYIQSVLK